MRGVIAVLPGDGIGPEVIAEALRVLDAVATCGGHTFDTRSGLIGGCAIEATGEPLPNETLSLCRASDAVLLGAVGGPQWDNLPGERRPERGLLALRQLLGVYANLRPVIVHDAVAAASPLRPDRIAGVNILVVRELTGGIYFGERRREPLNGKGELASDLCLYTTPEIERVVRVAAMLARGRRGRLTSVDKANVLETSRLWRQVTTRVLEDEFPDVILNHQLVDACAMHLLRAPADFDVIVTENMFGDILSDEASMLAGSIGLLPSASLGDAPSAAGAWRPALYEPIHGAAPDIAGSGTANPIGAIGSVAMMLRYSFELHEEARAVEDAISATLAAGWHTADIAAGGHVCSTSEIGTLVAEQVTADTR
ncbi:MAG TPA: 3-isopropylmalate dehydrogenase [Gemmatimonadaceae bacterium]|nr:3-isopropylmalate dehydrogenase [Gemmatimonadaceae bacterium]